MRVRRGLERGDLAGRIPQIALRDLPRKGGKTSSGPLFDQLLMAPLGPFLGTGRSPVAEVDLGIITSDRKWITKRNMRISGRCWRR